MEIVFEIVNRAGRVLERHRSAGELITIGRAYDNDLILPDETVNPHHAVLEAMESGEIWLRDLDSVNGIQSLTTKHIDRAIKLRSGSDYSFGRSRVRIFSTLHPVGETIKIGGLDSVVNWLGRRSTVLLAITVAIAVAVLEQWLNTYTTSRWQAISVGVVGAIAVCTLVAIFWAIVGRIAKHEGRFRTQLTLIIAYLVIQSGIVYGHDLLLFNSLNATASNALGLCLSFCLLAGFLWLALHIATNMLRPQILRVSLISAGVLLSLSLYAEIIERTEFTNRPAYIDTVMSPWVRIRNGVPLNHFVESSVAVFDQTNHDDKL